ncbi:MAG: amidase [Hyphomicrobiaceae bacterium]
MGTPSDPAALTATEALAAFRARTLSPVEVMQAVIARSERIDARIRAFSDTYFDEAMQAARRAEVRYCGTDGRPRPLEGLPLAVKDEMSELGKRITMGSLVFKDRIGTWTDAAVNRLTAAGAIAHARTVTPEFSLVGVCHSRLWGISRNPHNLAMSPGGSSGGAAAALAAGLTTLAIGSDIGGSIRIPASCCGIVGYMPPHGRVPDAPPHNLDPFSHTGPMARSVADCALMLNVMSGPHVADLATLRERVRIPAVMPGIAGWKVAYSLDFGYKTLDADVRANTLAALDVFRMLGCTVDEVSVPWTEDLPSIRRDYLYALWGSRMGDLLDNHRADLSDYTIRYAEAALGTSVAALHRAYDAITTIYEQFGRLMDRYHLFICPTTAVPAVAADHDPYASEFTIDGVSVDARSGWIMTYPFNALGRLPVMALPSGKARNGVPTGIQIIARSYDDKRCFRAAYAYEQAFGCLALAELA